MAAPTKANLELLLKQYEEKIVLLEDSSLYGRGVNFSWNGFPNRFFNVRCDNEYYLENAKLNCRHFCEHGNHSWNCHEEDCEFQCECQDSDMCTQEWIDFVTYCCPQGFNYNCDTVKRENENDPNIWIVLSTDGYKTPDDKYNKYYTIKEYEQYKIDNPDYKPEKSSQGRKTLDEADKWMLRGYVWDDGFQKRIYTLEDNSSPIIEANIKRLNKELLRQNCFRECMKLIGKNSL